MCLYLFPLWTLNFGLWISFISLMKKYECTRRGHDDLVEWMNGTILIYLYLLRVNLSLSLQVEKYIERYKQIVAKQVKKRSEARSDFILICLKSILTRMMPRAFDWYWILRDQRLSMTWIQLHEMTIVLFVSMNWEQLISIHNQTKNIFNFEKRDKMKIWFTEKNLDPVLVVKVRPMVW